MKKLIITASILSLTFVGLSIYTSNPVKPTKVTASTVVEKEQTVAPVAPEVVAQPAPVEEATPVQPQVTQVEQEVTYKWAKEMSEAGISESDYALVTEMLLDDNGWRTTGERVWYKSTRTIGAGTLVGNLKFANDWVIAGYNGSWSQANQRFINSGNF
jgi:hypothetical protein